MSIFLCDAIRGNFTIPCGPCWIILEIPSLFMGFCCSIFIELCVGDGRSLDLLGCFYSTGSSSDSCLMPSTHFITPLYSLKSPTFLLILIMATVCEVISTFLDSGLCPVTRFIPSHKSPSIWRSRDEGDPLLKVSNASLLEDSSWSDLIVS